VDEVWAGTTLYAFDGRVLEVFGFPGSESMRFHVLNLRIEVDEPDRKGRRWLRVRPLHGSGGMMVEVQAEEWPALGPFLDRVGTAIAAQ
jgi:hypothetical protein